MVPSFVRTVVPYIVGVILYWIGWALFEVLGTEVDLSELVAPLSQIVAIALAALWYLFARWLERNKDSKWGWLIGLATQPVYPPKEGRVTPTSETPDTL